MGVDTAHGRFGQVSIETCRACGALWLRYALEYEAFPGSGRWYRGPIDAEQVRTLTAENAVALLEAMPWRFCGGSFFRSTGKRCTGPLRLAPGG